MGAGSRSVAGLVVRHSGSLPVGSQINAAYHQSLNKMVRKCKLSSDGWLPTAGHDLLHRQFHDKCVWGLIIHLSRYNESQSQSSYHLKRGTEWCFIYLPHLISNVQIQSCTPDIISQIQILDKLRATK